MLIGPVFHRELTISPRRRRTYLVRSAYVWGLLLLMSTAWLVLTGTQLVRDVGEMSRFGLGVFQLLAPLQMAMALFFSALLAASTVAQEKDRRTVSLLLLTRLTNAELVLGTLLASLWDLISLWAAAVPVFLLVVLFGGTSVAQVVRVMGVTLAAVLAAGSLGATLAQWREKTYQAVALSMLAVVAWLGAGEAVAAGLAGEAPGGVSAASWAAALSPFRAVLAAARPFLAQEPQFGWLGSGPNLFMLFAVAVAAGLCALSILLVRRWNAAGDSASNARGEKPWQRDRAAAPAVEAADALPTPLGKSREVWDNPVLWREMRTWAYGRRIALLRLIYLAAIVGVGWRVGQLLAVAAPLAPVQLAWWLAPVALVSLVLVNAQAVTSITSERDTGALDLLLVTDLTPLEIVWGKLGGALYNAKEMLILPIVLAVWIASRGALRLEDLLYLVGGWLVLASFAAVLGIHVGMSYAASRTAIAVSLGTLFFLMVGVATCMRIMIAFSGSFQAQLQPFLAFMVGGGLGLYAALGMRNPSSAIGLAAFLCPFATFYAITSFLMDYTLAPFLVIAGAYGFATAAMLVPAIYEFDVATGRTGGREEG